MKKQKLNTLVALGLLLPMFGQAQLLDDPSNRPIRSVIEQSTYYPSAQTWEFVRYGNTPVDLYTGKARADIPVYTYSDTDFTIPVSLGYVSDGFMPAQQTGIVGLNWFLNAGGVITREIRGLDDFNGQGRNGTRGFLVMNDKFDDAQLLKNSTDHIVDMPSVGQSETRSDIYHFSFMGHSGTFHYDGKRNCKVYNTDGNHGCYEIINRREGGSLSEFTIKTADGYLYTFGSTTSSGEEQYVERLLCCYYKLGVDDCIMDQYAFTEIPIVSWMLREIKAPNGRTVKFVYENGELPQDPYINSKFAYPNLIVTFLPDQYSFSGKEEPVSWNDTLHYRRPKVLKTTYLSQINIDNRVTVDFAYSQKDTTEVQPLIVPYWRTVQKLFRLSKITVNAVGQTDPLRTCALSYRTLDLRTLLTRVSVAGLGSYTMDYYTAPSNSPMATFPDLLSTCADFWGYANGSWTQTDRNFLSGTKTDTSWNEFAELNSIKNPNSAYSIYGNLKTLTYPTGGRTEFEYEGHSANYAVLKRFKHDFENEEILDDPVLDYEDFDANVARVDWGAFTASLHNFKSLCIPDNSVGGIRVRKITDDDGEGCRTSRTFTYKNSLNQPSGNLLHFPRYLGRFKDRNITVRYMFITHTRTAFDKSHIEYSRVTETRSDNSKIIYNYTNYRTNPDDYSDQTKIEQYAPSPITNKEFADNILRNPNSRNNQRGKLRSAIYYNAAGKKVRKESYTYKDALKDSGIDYSTFVVLSGVYNWSTKLYTGDYRLVGKKITDYLPSGERVVETQYDYNMLGQRSMSKIIDGADTLIERTRYIPDVEKPLFPGQAGMLERHMLAPVEQKQFRMYSGVENLTGGTAYEYRMLDSMPRLRCTKTLLTAIPLTVSAQTRLEYQTDITYDAYDAMGNVLQTTDRSGVVTSYIWGYGGLYLLAEVKQATIDKLAVMGFPKAGARPLAGALTPQQESALRKMAGALVTTYDYLPYVGVSRITDPSGRKTTYKYDSIGKLSRIIDTENNPVVGYSYWISK